MLHTCTIAGRGAAGPAVRLRLVFLLQPAQTGPETFLITTFYCPSITYIPRQGKLYNGQTLHQTQQ